MTALLESGSPRVVRAAARRRAPRGARGRADCWTPANGWAWWANPAAGRPRRSLPDGSAPVRLLVQGWVSPTAVHTLAGTEKTIAPDPLAGWVGHGLPRAMNALNPVQTVGTRIVEPMELTGSRKGPRAGAPDGQELPRSSWPRRPRLHPFPAMSSAAGCANEAAIAMALACEPKSLADEPTTALDVMVQAQILESSSDLTVNSAWRLGLVTHDILEGRTNLVLVRRDVGRRHRRGRPDATLFHEPRHPYTRLLFAATPDPERDGAGRLDPRRSAAARPRHRRCPFGDGATAR